MEKANHTDSKLKKYTARKVAGKMGVWGKHHPDLTNFPKQAK